MRQVEEMEKRRKEQGISFTAGLLDKYQFRESEQMASRKKKKILHRTFKAWRIFLGFLRIEARRIFSLSSKYFRQWKNVSVAFKSLKEKHVRYVTTLQKYISSKVFQKDVS